MNHGRDLNHCLRRMFIEVESEVEEGPSRLQDCPKLLVAVCRQAKGLVDFGGRYVVNQIPLRDLETKF